ncbi:MAG: four helix bundle protein [bacterium]
MGENIKESDNQKEKNRGQKVRKNEMKCLLTSRREDAETQNHLREMADKQYHLKSDIQKMIDEYEEIKRGINGMIRRVQAKNDPHNEKGVKRF